MNNERKRLSERKTSEPTDPDEKNNQLTQTKNNDQSQNEKPKKTLDKKIPNLHQLIADRLKFLKFLKAKGRFLAARKIQKVVRGYLTRKQMSEIQNSIQSRLREVLGRAVRQKAGETGAENRGKIDILFDIESRAKGSEGDTVGVFSTNLVGSGKVGSEGSVRGIRKKSRVVSGLIWV